MKIICEKCDHFFINVSPPLSKKILNQNCIPDPFIKMKAVYSLYLELVTESEIKELVTALKPAAPGYDNLRSSILKLSLPFISFPLTYYLVCLYNKVFFEINALPFWILQDHLGYSSGQTRCL